MNRNKIQMKSGASLTECLVLSNVLAGGFILIFGVALLTGARALLQLDTFRLARSHLYGNNRAECSASEIWPIRIRNQIQITCSRDGEVEATLSIIMKILTFTFHEKANLKPETYL